MDNGVSYRSELFNDYIQGYRNLTDRQKSLIPDSKDEGQLLDEMNAEAERLRDILSRSQNDDERRIALNNLNARDFAKETDEIVRNRDSINQKAQETRAQIEEIKNRKETVLTNAEKVYNEKKAELTNLIEKLENTPGIKDPSIDAALEQARKELRDLERDWKLFNIQVKGISKEVGEDSENVTKNNNKQKADNDKSDNKNDKADDNKNDKNDDKKADDKDDNKKLDNIDRNDNKNNSKWGPLTPEEIDDAIQLGFTEYTPGDGESFDRFLIDHGYNPEKLKAEKDAMTRNSNTNKGWGPLTPEEIDDAIQLGFTEYTPGDGESFDRFLIDHGYNPEKLKEQEKRPEGPTAGSAVAARTPTTPDSADPAKAADWGIDSGAGATFTTGNPNKNAPTEPAKPSAIHAASSPVVTNIDNNQISSEIKYNGDNYVLSRTVNGKVEDEAKFTFFEDAEVRSNRKRISIMKNDSSIAELLKAHPEVTNKQLKMADPTILKGLAIDKKYYGLALSYLQELGKGKNANKEKIKDSELGDISISYNVPADDSKFGFMKKMAKNHKNIADIKLPSFADRIKSFFGIGQDVFGKPEEKPALAPAKEEVKKSKKPGELSPEEKKEVNERTEKLSMAKKRIDAAREKRLKMSQEEFRASLDEEDLAMYDALTEESDKIAFRKCEPNMRYTFANRGNSEPQIKE